MTPALRYLQPLPVCLQVHSSSPPCTMGTSERKMQQGKRAAESSWIPPSTLLSPLRSERREKQKRPQKIPLVQEYGFCGIERGIHSLKIGCVQFVACLGKELVKRPQLRQKSMQLNRKKAEVGTTKLHDSLINSEYLEYIHHFVNWKIQPQ